MKLIKQEINAFTKGSICSLENVVPRRTDILVIGGGIVGSAVAFFLKNKMQHGLDVTVVERDHCVSVGQFGLTRAVEISCLTCPTRSHFIQDKSKISIYLSLDKYNV